MFLQPIVGLVKTLAEQFSKPQTYGMALEEYIVSHNPQNAADVDRLMREFEHRHEWAL